VNFTNHGQPTLAVWPIRSCIHCMLG